MAGDGEGGEICVTDVEKKMGALTFPVQITEGWPCGILRFADGRDCDG